MVVRGWGVMSGGEEVGVMGDGEGVGGDEWW